MKAVLAAVVVSMAISAWVWAAERPKAELEEMVAESRALGERCQFGHVKVRDKAFLKRIMECKDRMDEYTLEHACDGLDFWKWGVTFVDIYSMASRECARDYAEAESWLEKGLELISRVRGKDELAAPRTRLEVVVAHVQAWVESNPGECSRVWDQTGAWVRRLGMADLTELWSFHRATLEVRLLACADRLPEGKGKEIAERRARVLSEYLADKSVKMRFRCTALGCLVYYLTKKGEAGRASRAVEQLGREPGATADYYYARMLVALWGQGDWAKATETLDEFNRYIARTAYVKPSVHRMHRNALDMYYGNLLVPDVEMRRQGRTAAKERGED